MKRIVMMTLAGFWSFAALAGGPQYAVEVDGLACPFCAYGVEKHLSRIDGVRDVETDVASGRVVVVLEEGASLDEARARRAVDNAGFTLRGFERLAPEAGQ